MIREFPVCAGQTPGIKKKFVRMKQYKPFHRYDDEKSTPTNNYII